MALGRNKEMSRELRKQVDNCDINDDYNGNEGWERRTAGAWDVDASWAPGMFYLYFYIYSTNFILQWFEATTQPTNVMKERWTRAGARDADVFRAPGIFYFCFLYILD